jgi:hypothetical protein
VRILQGGCDLVCTQAVTRADTQRRRWRRRS